MNDYYGAIGNLSAEEITTWQDKAKWLQANGYALSIHATAKIGNEDANLWMACIEGEGRRYGRSIGEVVEQVYDWVISSARF